MRVSQGNDGWHRITDTDLDGEVYVRVRDVNGRLRMTELYIDGGDHPIPSSWLRHFQVQAVEQTAEYLAEVDPEETASRLELPGPDLSRLATYYSTIVGETPTTVPGRYWAYDALRASAGDPRVKQSHRQPLPAASPLPPEPQLDAPPPGRLTDAYLSDVAEAYARAVALGRPPANALAELAEVSPRTVHGWVAKARKRGMMPPAASKGRIV